MIRSHRPDDPRWQLLRHDVSMEDFVHAPRLQPRFTALGLGLRSPASVEVTSREPYVDVELDNPRWLIVRAQVRAEGAEPQRCATSERQARGVAALRCPAPRGASTIGVFAGPPGERLLHVGSFRVTRY